MKKTLLVIVSAGLCTVAMANKDKKGASTMKTEDCGAMLKSVVPLPTKFAELMNAVSAGMDAHAAMVAAGSKDPAAQAEAAAMKKIAADHHDLALAATKAAADMTEASKLAPAPHDMSKMDPKAAEGMATQVKLEREMAALMVKHADDTDKMLASMKPAGK